MSTGLVAVFAVAALIPLLLGLMPALRLPGALLETVAGIVLGPSVLGWVTPDATVRVIASPWPAATSRWGAGCCCWRCSWACSW